MNKIDAVVDEIITKYMEVLIEDGLYEQYIDVERLKSLAYAAIEIDKLTNIINVQQCFDLCAMRLIYMGFAHTDKLSGKELFSIALDDNRLIQQCKYLIGIGKKIYAIKLYKKATGSSLKEATTFVKNLH